MFIRLDFSGRMGDGPLSKKCVTDYLKANRGFLENHVLENVDAETLERWYIRRVQREKNTQPQSGRKQSEDRSIKKISVSRWKVRSFYYFNFFKKHLTQQLNFLIVFPTR